MTRHDDRIYTVLEFRQKDADPLSLYPVQLTRKLTREKSLWQVLLYVCRKNKSKTPIRERKGTRIIIYFKNKKQAVQTNKNKQIENK
jgi:hypothetical protein